MPTLPTGRARRGSLARPVNARMYRGTWLLVGLPLLAAAFSIGRAAPLPAPRVPPTFDGEAPERSGPRAGSPRSSRSTGSGFGANSFARSWPAAGR